MLNLDKMAIKTIEIICRPCSRCKRLTEIVKRSIRGLEVQYQTKIIYEFKITTNLVEAAKYSMNISKRPLLIINGHAEGAGNMEPAAVTARIRKIHME
jgi:hypothetical protein